jgi:excisionase family DNA binding protein
MNSENRNKQPEFPSLPVDPRAFGLTKAAYTVGETLNLLSIGRTSLYAAVKQGHLHPVKFGRKTLFYATDLAAFLKMLKERRS